MLQKHVFGIVSSMLIISTGHAQVAGDFVANVGWFHIAPQDSSQPLTVNALGTSAAESGTSVSMDNADTLGFNVTYFITDHIGTTAVLGIPAKFQVAGSGSLSELGPIASAREWSPTLLLRYYFNGAQDHLRPYLGAGASYVTYSGVKLNSAAASGTFLSSPEYGEVLEGPTTASLSSSLAPVVNAGFAYNIDKHWSVDASLSYMRISTRATLSTQSKLGIVTTSTKIKVDPIISFVSVGYRF